MISFRKKLGLFAIVLLSFGFALILAGGFSGEAFAHTVTLSTSGTVNLEVSPAGVGNSNGASLGVDTLEVTSTCPLGYTLSIAGPTDSTLYKGGDNTNNAGDQTISASSGTVATPASILGNNLGTWGYTTTSNATVNSDFIGLTNTATTIATRNSASATGGDTIPVYYGASVTATTEPGLYKLAESTAGAGDNVITYYLTTSPNCNSYIIKYDDNGANSTTTMGNQTLSASAITVDLWPSNFQRSGYGFAGWNTRADGTGTNFGPMEKVIGAALQTLKGQAVVENGQQVIKLYAKWVQSAGSIQSWTGCSSLASGVVTALTDTRDNNTYAVAKLADGKCWMIENLRLGSTATIDSSNTQNPASGFTLSASQDPTQTAWCAANSTDCVNQSMLFTGNTTNTIVNMTTPTLANNDNAGIYSYGNYYNWYSVTAGSTASAGYAKSSICPAGWHLPTGGNGGEFRTLNTNANSGSTSSSSGLRAYPTNFLYSGTIGGSLINRRGEGGNYWSSSANNSYGAYLLSLTSNIVYPNTNSYKYYGLSARCMSSDTYAIHFDSNGGTGTINNQIAFVDNTITLTSNSFAKSGATFIGWNTAADGSGTAYADGASVMNLPATAGVATLYAQWGCEANKVCYSDNGANSPTTMSNESVRSTATSINLWPSNFQRSGYGFAGWNTKADGSGTMYGPNETINFTAGQYSTTGLQLYAIWVQSAGNLQNWSGCSSLASGAVTALKDTRDNQVYAVAKLADGKCWMIENLRLNHTNSDNNTGALSQGYGGQFSGLALPETANYTDVTTANSLYYAGTGNEGSLGATINILQENYAGYRMPRYRNDNTNTDSTINPNTTVSNMTGTNQNIYSYGNYYSWPAAKANTSPLTSIADSNAANTSLCPAGWRLPRGGDKANESTNDFWSLVVTGINNGTNPANYDSSSSPYYTGSTEAGPVNKLIRKFPNNFVYTGYIDGSSVHYRGSDGYYWSATANGSLNAYYFYFYSGRVYPSTYGGSKYFGRTIRCVVSP